MENSEERLRDIIRGAGMVPILRAIRDTGLPGPWLAGGAVRNTVWKHLFGDDCQLGIKDFDVAFFEATSPEEEANGRDREAQARGALEHQFPQYKFDVKNQASFGVWRTGKFLFTSAEDGIAHWLHTATAVGVRLNGADEMEVFCPYGLDDLFGGVIRPTPSQRGEPNAEAKKKEFLSKCPSLVTYDRQ